ncbi:tape measure protein [Nevskia sp.]|uniref:tape measure protein n=1 Tax=Nevskia sp. TaxID=1929292 RepID=UPI0025E0B118|nr:tape measure protein [Nevskia sp.]
MTAISYSVEIDGRQAEPQVRKIDNSLARLKASGDNVTSSMDKLGKELGDTASSLSGAEKRSLALIKAQTSLTAASRSQERALISLTDVLRSHAEQQRVVGNDLTRVKLASDGAASTMAALSRTVAGGAVAFAGFKVAEFAADAGRAGLELNNLDIRLKTVFGSSQAAGKEFEFIRDTSRRLSIDLQATGNAYSSLAASAKGTTLEGQATRDIFSAVAEAGGKLRLSADQVQGSLLAVSQIISKGTLSSEELRGQLAERLPGAFQIAARAMGVTTGELGKLLEQGAIASDVFLPKFAAELRKTLGTDATTQIEAFNTGFKALESEGAVFAKTFFTPIAEGASRTAGAFATLLRAINDTVAKNNDLEDLGNGLFRRDNGMLFQRNKVGGLDFVNEPRGDIRNAIPQAPRSILPDFAGVVPKIPAVQDFGPGFGAQFQVQAETKKTAELREQLALVGARTNLEKALYEITKGDRSGASNVEKNLLVELAKERDRIVLANQAKREGLKLETDSERLQKQMAQQDAGRANTIYQLIRGTQDQSAELQRQLQTGEELTTAGRELLRLRSGELDFQFRGREAAKEQLAIELEGLDTLQKKVVEQDRLNDAARKAADELQDGPSAPGGGQRIASQTDIPRTFKQVEFSQNVLRSIEEGKFEQRERALRGGTEASLRDSNRLKEGETINDLVEKAREAHEKKLSEITRQGAEQRNQVTQSYLQTGSLIVANLSAAAESAGLARSKRGFEAAKVLSIAQAGISTASAVLNALAVPPYPLGVALAASAGVAGLAQIAAIKSQKFGGGRELGGPVDSSRFFEIGEKGRPEIIQDDGKYFLFGANGNVIPASNGNAGGASEARTPIQILISNTVSNLASIQAEESQGLNGETVIRIVAEALTDNASPVSRGVQRRAGRRAEGLIG